jgi:hypothetical protein
MQGLKIGKPPVYNENENVNMNVMRAYLERSAAQAAAAKPVVNEEEEVWEIPNAVFNIKNVAVGNNSSVPLNVQRNLSWANKPPSTPKAQMIRPRNKPPALKSKRKTRRNRKGRKSRKQNRR